MYTLFYCSILLKQWNSRKHTSTAARGSKIGICVHLVVLAVLNEAELIFTEFVHCSIVLLL